MYLRQKSEVISNKRTTDVLSSINLNKSSASLKLGLTTWILDLKSS